jgi:hypothetical protein
MVEMLWSNITALIDLRKRISIWKFLFAHTERVDFSIRRAKINRVGKAKTGAPRPFVPLSDPAMARKEHLSGLCPELGFSIRKGLA